VGLVTQAPDSAARARYARVRTVLDDSLTAVEAAAAGFQSDLAGASSDLVASRSERLRRRCDAAEGASEPLLAMLTTTSALRRDLVTLRAALNRCRTEFVVGRGQPPDSLKAWAPYRLARLGEAARRYRLSVRTFDRGAGLK
jgi:hypothetical protein